jgi:hypothetical protein
MKLLPPAVVAATAVLPTLAAVLPPASPAAVTPHKVLIAPWIHVNLYHPFCNETNDENGFGQDLRVIRSTIAAPGRFNREGIPAATVWDIDNLFSLQETLPVGRPVALTIVPKEAAG